MTNTTTDTVRGKLADKANGTSTELATTEPELSPAVRLRKAIDAQARDFAAVLPAGVDLDRFARLTLTAVKSTPELFECFATPAGKASVLLAAMEAAALGLEPNTPTQQCWLLPRWNSKTRATECELQIGYRGWRKLAMQSGTITDLQVDTVHEEDLFRWWRDETGLHFEHAPDLNEADRGAMTHVYAVARLANGGTQGVLLSRADVEQRRAASPSWSNEKSRPYSPWHKWPKPMACKSAIRALIPMLDLSTDGDRALGSDERTFRYNADDETIDANAFEVPAPEATPAFETSEGEPGAASPPGDATDEAGDGAADHAADGTAPAEPAPSKLMLRKLHALMNGAGIEGDQARHDWMADELGRPIASANDLTKAEASTLIDTLEAQAKAGAQ